MKLLVSVCKVECRTFKSYLSVCLFVSVNNAVRCTLHVLSTIWPVPSHRSISMIGVTPWLGHYRDARA